MLEVIVYTFGRIISEKGVADSQLIQKRQKRPRRLKQRSPFVNRSVHVQRDVTDVIQCVFHYKSARSPQLLQPMGRLVPKIVLLVAQKSLLPILNLDTTSADRDNAFLGSLRLNYLPAMNTLLPIPPEEFANSPLQRSLAKNWQRI